MYVFAVARYTIFPDKVQADCMLQFVVVVIVVEIVVVVYSVFNLLF